MAVRAQALYGIDRDALRGDLEKAGFPAYRADQVLRWLYEKHIGSLDEAANLPLPLRRHLSDHFVLSSLSLHEKHVSDGEESAKFLFLTHDRFFLESVLIVQENRRTVCVSTQLGCKMGCVFCASGKGRFVRSLTAGEIVEQALWIEKDCGARLTNVVFMGMGEPLDNFEPVMKALEILQAPWGFGLGARRITVSTSGVTPKILEFVERSEGRVRLSVSLHSADDAVRTRLVPLNKKYPVRELAKALRDIHGRLKREITFEVTLLGGVNDSRRDAEGVASLAKPLSAKVNLIPYNPIREMDFKTPSPESIDRFRKVLEARGIRVTLRQTAGREIHAACGQLRLEKETTAADSR
ncbi:MAG: 23S rRNA (adenine(2503)-C(2))-methyltransferase RlmN [Candidatus Omnitrophota bacterium]|jgi:23S rRNA (adenine2503-C2)-methyltransferase